MPHPANVIPPRGRRSPEQHQIPLDQAPPAPGANPRPPKEESEDSSPLDSNEIIASVELPSKGRFYGETCPEGIVYLRPMTGRDEALVAGMDAGDMVEVFDLLLERCLKTPGLKVDDMLSTDKFYLMLCLRANSYGSHYEFRVRCQSCGLFNSKSCEVPEDFEIIEAKDEEKEPFKVILPRSSAEVEFRLLRGSDDKAIMKWRNKELERGRVIHGDPSYVYRMAKHIVSINGESVENIGVSMDFFENLIAGDASALANAIEDKVTGVNTEIDVTCSRCRTKFKTDMPFTAGFFRSQQRTTGESS